jgi:hypothetical protein
MQTTTLKQNSYLGKAIASFQDTCRIAREDKNFLVMTYLARFVAIREWVSRHGKTKGYETLRSHSTQISTADDFKACIEALSAEGYYTGLTLSPHKTQELLEFAFTYPCYGNRNSQEKLTITSPAMASQGFGDNHYQVASYSNDIEQCKTVLALSRDPVILALARQYIGHEPVYYRSELLWTFPEDPLSETIYTQFFHCDINDYRNIKFFFYLTDVDHDCGPHSYIKGSHRHRGLRRQLQGGKIYPDQEEQLIKFYGADQVTTICGSSGSGFIGDPYCLHRGGKPKHKARLMLQMEFGSRQYGSCHAHHR